MTVRGVDYAWGRPEPKGLYSLGYRFASRYLSWLPNSKVIDAGERDRLLAAGLDVMLNWEFRANDQMGGAAAGTEQALEAVKQAKTLHYPPGATIYYSADWDLSRAQWDGPVSAYQRAARAITNGAGYRFGVYGGLNLVTWSFDAGIAQDGWQTYAWSTRNGVRTWDKRAALRQVRNGVNILGVDCDEDETTGAPVYWWRHTATPAQPEEDEMDPQAAWNLIWTVDGIARGNNPIVIPARPGGLGEQRIPNGTAAAVTAQGAALQAIASKVDLDPVELAAIQESLVEAAKASAPAVADAIAAAVVAKLPADVMTPEQVEQAVRDAFAGGLAPDQA